MAKKVRRQLLEVTKHWDPQIRSDYDEQTHVTDDVSPILNELEASQITAHSYFSALVETSAARQKAEAVDLFDYQLLHAGSRETLIKREGRLDEIRTT
jgi:hypothetical protein